MHASLPPRVHPVGYCLCFRTVIGYCLRLPPFSSTPSAPLISYRPPHSRLSISFSVPRYASRLLPSVTFAALYLLQRPKVHLSSPPLRHVRGSQPVRKRSRLSIFFSVPRYASLSHPVRNVRGSLSPSVSQGTLSVVVFTKHGECLINLPVLMQLTLFCF